MSGAVAKSPGGLEDLLLARYVPGCAPDCDGSGSLDIEDFVCFQGLFAVGDLDADCERDGDLDIDDFVCFQTGFAVGCP